MVAPSSTRVANRANARSAAPTSRPTRRVSLLAVFGLTSLLVVSGIGVAIGLALQDSIRSRAISDAAQTGEIAANLGVRPFLEVDDLQRNFMPLPTDRVESLDASLGSSLSPNGIVRIKVWNRQHWLVYSDNPNLRGAWFAGSETLERSFEGELTTEITDLTAPEEREERDFGELLAVYVPLRAADGEFTSDPDADIIGAFEIYLPFEPIAADIAADTRRLVGVLVVGLAILYLSLFRLVAGASRKLRRQSEQNLYLATHDSLTGLNNRDAFIAQVDAHRRSLKPNEPGGMVILADLDRFQQINNTLGHDVGDELLTIISQRLASHLRDQDLVARLGGDEFAFLLTSIGNASTVEVISRLIAVLDAPVELANIRLEVRASFGAVRCTSDLPAEVAVQQADIAMYAAKRDQTTIEFFRPSLDELTAESLELAAEVRVGIDSKQFDLHYQPKYDLQTGDLTGSEALVRWNHPTRGMVPPTRFIPTIEQMPIGRDLTDYILDRALTDMAAWRELGIDIGVSINLSPRDVNDLELPNTIERALSGRMLDPALLTVELTEGSILANEERAMRCLNAIRDLGCGVSIDDFGTGYASLSHLIKLPATELKIDQSFVAAVGSDETSFNIVKHCIEIAQAFGLATTAEGIETDEVEEIVRSLGCETGQGYLHGRPVPLADFVAFAQEANSTNPVAAGAPKNQ